MPIGTPANAIAYSSGHLSMRDMMIPGAILAVSSWVVFNLVARFFWPLLGISLGAGRRRSGAVGYGPGTVGAVAHEDRDRVERHVDRDRAPARGTSAIGPSSSATCPRGR